MRSVCQTINCAMSRAAMDTIPKRHTEELDVYQLRVFDALFREHTLTRAAEALSTKQPTLSKTLARLRRYFDDPLFVRVSLRMEPTAKALELVGPIRTLLDELQWLRASASHSTRRSRTGRSASSLRMQG